MQLLLVVICGAGGDGAVAISCYVWQVETGGGAAPALTAPAGRHSAARQEQQPMCSISLDSTGK